MPQYVLYMQCIYKQMNAGKNYHELKDESKSYEEGRGQGA